MAINNKAALIHGIQDSKTVLFRYLKNPITEIGHLPGWSWLHILILQIAITASCGFLRSVISGSGALGLITGTVLNPILIIVTSFVSCIFFYYCFQVFAHKTVDFKKLYELIFFANIPFYIFLILVVYVPPIFLVGFAFTGLLLFKGFIQHFQLERKLVSRLIFSLFFVMFLLWVWQRIENMQFQKDFRDNQSSRPIEIQLGE